MTITTLDALSDEQQEVWATIPVEYLDILHNMTLDEQFQYLGIRRKDYYICDTFHEEPCLLSYDCDGNEDVFTYDGVIVAVQITNRPLLRLGIPYKETVIEDQEYMDSHTHEIVRYSNVPHTYYNVLCYSLEHLRFQELLAKKEEEKKRAKEALSHCYQLAKAAGDEAVMRSIERELS